MDRESRQRNHMEKGFRTIAHYADRANSLLDPERGGKNLAPFASTHKQYVDKLDEVRAILDRVLMDAQRGLKGGKLQ